MNFNDFFLEDLPPTVRSGKPPEYQALVHELLPQLSMFYSKLDPGMTRACGWEVNIRQPIFFCTRNNEQLPSHQSRVRLIKQKQVWYWSNRNRCDTKPPVSCFQHPAFSMQLPASSFQPPVPSFEHPASSICSFQLAASSFKHRECLLKTHEV